MSSLREYLKRYESAEQDQKKKKKKKKKPSAPAGVLIVDQDPVWAKQVDPDAEEESEAEETPVVDEDVEVKRMRRLEELRARKPYHSISEDGSGWVSIPNQGKVQSEPGSALDLSPPRQRRARFDTPSPEPRETKQSRSASEVGHSTNPVDDLSPPRRRISSPPNVDLSPPRRRMKVGDDLSPPQRRISSPPNENLSPPRRRMKVGDDLSPPRRRISSPPNENLSPPRRRMKVGDDLSPPRRRISSPPNENLSPPRRRMKVGDDLSPPRRRESSPQDEDLSPPGRRKEVTDVEMSPRRRRVEDEDMSPVRRDNRVAEADLSPPRRRKYVPRDEYSSPLRSKVASDDLSPPRRRRYRSPELPVSPRKASKGLSEDLSPLRRERKGRQMELPPRSERRVSSGDLSQPRREKGYHGDLSPHGRGSHQPKVDSSPPRKPKEAQGVSREERRAGLFTGREVKEEIDRKKKEEVSRFAALDPSLSGRGAEPVYRDKEGKRITKEEMQLQKVKEKPKEKKLEWGKGLVQKREAEARITDLELEKEKPFARSRDDPELDKMLRERTRWGDPMAHLVKKRQSSPLALEDLGDDEKMKESGFIIPQAVPIHSWLKRGVDPPANRYGIRPGRHWDGVDRSNGFEKQMFQRQNERQATQTEAYLWSVSDM